jgi:hypothetical protein
LNAALAALGPVRIMVRTARSGLLPGRLTSRGRVDRTMRDPELVARAARNGVSHMP